MRTINSSSSVNSQPTCSSKARALHQQQHQKNLPHMCADIKGRASRLRGTSHAASPYQYVSKYASSLITWSAHRTRTAAKVDVRVKMKVMAMRALRQAASPYPPPRKAATLQVEGSGRVGGGCQQATTCKQGHHNAVSGREHALTVPLWLHHVPT
jgi:hypothetical protein